MAYVHRMFIVILMASPLIYCTANTHNRSRLTIEDTTSLVQYVLTDSQFESKIIKNFGDEQLKLITGPATKIDQQYVFAGKSVRIVPSEGDVYQLHKQYPKALYVSIPEVRFFSKDSATVLIIFHAGNTTALFKLKRDNENWLIVERQYGKF